MFRSLRAITSEEYRERLRWAVRVRWLVIAGFFVLAVVAARAGLLPSLWPCTVAAAAAVLVNGVNHWCVSRGRGVRAVTALAIPGDVLLITYVILNTGGVESPFVMMYVVQVVSTAMLVSLPVAAVGAAASVACLLAALALQEAGFVGGAGLGDVGGSTYRLVWALYLLYCLALLAYVGGYISERLRDSERDLAATNRNLREALASLKGAHADLEEAYARLRSTEAQLVHSEKMRALGQFVAGIAHELNNPLAFVGGNLDYIRQTVEALSEMLEVYRAADLPAPAGALLAEKRRILRVDPLLADLPAAVADCTEGVRRSTEIVRELRDFARGDLSGPQWRRCDLHASIDRALLLLRHRVGGAVAIEKRYEPIPEIECVSGQIEQVFVNLLANAFDAIGAGGGTIRVGTRVDPGDQIDSAGPCVVVSIADDGPGIAPEVRQRVFEPFYTTKVEGEGTGLGLSVSYGIVERHGGVITVESEPGVGTAFHVFLPFSRQAPKAPLRA
jgi:signal transduction histidine kinase